MDLPRQATLIEVGPRDGFQAESRSLPTGLKIQVIEGLAEAGLRQIQIASFVHPERVPQMADAEQVVAGLERRPGVVYSGLVLNRRGLERALATGLEQVDLSLAVTETLSRRNANTTIREAMAAVREMCATARREGVSYRVGLQSVFGCAYEGAVPAGRVLAMAGEILELEPEMISLADTTGLANPRQMKELLSELLPLSGETPLQLHLHDTRGAGLANLVAALECGITAFDTSLGGLGGCPFVPGAAGNVATEDVVYLLESMGVATGVELAGVARWTRRLEGFLGHPFPGKMYHLAAGDEG